MTSNPANTAAEPRTAAGRVLVEDEPRLVTGEHDMRTRVLAIELEAYWQGHTDGKAEAAQDRPAEPHRDYAGRTCTTGLLHSHEDRPAEPGLHYDMDAVNDLLQRATNVWVRRGEIPSLAEKDWHLLERAMDRVRMSLAASPPPAPEAGLREALADFWQQIMWTFAGHPALGSESRLRQMWMALNRLAASPPERSELDVERLAKAVLDNVAFDEDSGHPTDLCRYCMDQQRTHASDCVIHIAARLSSGGKDTPA